VALRASILGGLESEPGSLNDAKSHYHQALPIIGSLCGQDHPDVATILNSLGKAARAQGEIAEARSCFARALAILRANLKEAIPTSLLHSSIWRRFCRRVRPQESIED